MPSIANTWPNSWKSISSATAPTRSRATCRPRPDQASLDQTPLRRGFVFSACPIKQPGEQHAGGQRNGGQHDAGPLEAGRLLGDELLHAGEQFGEGGDIATILVVH